MSDIVERLRESAIEKMRHSFDCGNCGIEANVANDAADEIERLRARLAAFANLEPPTVGASEVYAKTSEQLPDADMRAIPNQWLLNERGRAQKACDELEARLSEAERDAARYRWLREGNGYLDFRLWNVLSDVEMKRGAELDAAIDAFLERQP